MNTRLLNSLLAGMLLPALWLVSPVAEAQNTTVVVTAHPDDWQLFMNPHVAKQMRDTTETVVFIHTSAGDAGRGTGFNHYYLAREEGSLRGIRFLNKTLRPDKPKAHILTGDTIRINNREIARYKSRNVHAYFLRLPDGNPQGTGYELHGNTSMEKLYSGRSESIAAIDKSASYTLEALYSTLEEIITTHHTKGGDLSLNLAETDTTLNPGDHSDHLYSSYIFQELASRIPVTEFRFYREYCTADMPGNLNQPETYITVGTWGATVSGLIDRGHYSTWDKHHNSWLDKMYVRTVKK